MNQHATRMKLMFLFGTFRPSERVVLLAAAQTQPGEFLGALESFLEKWADADWIEEYNVERVGEWIASKCPIQVRLSAMKMAQSEMNKATATQIGLLTYQAFLTGMDIKSNVVEVHAVSA